MVLTIIMSVWVVVIAIFVTGTAVLYPSRTMLAWSIDGMAPAKLADVNEKYHSPHWAILVCIVVAEITLALFAFTTLLGVVSGFLGLAVNFVLVCGWCILFPFVRKSTFESSPIAWRFAGIPVLSIIGFVAIAFIIPMMFRLLTDHTFSLNLNFVIWGAVIAIVAGFVWYVGWKAYERSKGVDVDRRFAEIPIE